MTNLPLQMTEIESFELPAGRYLVACPGEGIDSDFLGERWNNFLDECDYGSQNTVEFEGSEVFVVETGGDGAWNHKGETYYIEAGLFGAVPEELVKDENAKGVWVDAPNGLEIDVIRDSYGNLRAVKVGEVEALWYDFENEEIAEFAYENADYSVITTRELYDALMTYIAECDEDDLAEAREALPQFA